MATLTALLTRPATWEFEPNPVLKREVRARWRRWPAFGIVCAYTILFNLGVTWIYNGVSIHAERATVGGGAYQYNYTNIGHDLFEQITLLQIVAWMLLAPALTAPSIAGERERGLLDGLHTSPLHPGVIVRGKLMSAMAFITLMQLVPLPATAVCFMMGGVATDEFLLAVLLQFVTAMACATIGLYCSSLRHETPQALFRALMGSLLLAAGPLISPVWTSMLLFKANGFAFVAIDVILLSALTLGLLNRAAAALLKPLLPPVMALSATPRHVSRDLPMQADNEVEYDPAKFQRWDMPFAHKLRFENPVLQREVIIRLRLRQAAAGVDNGTTGCLAVFFVLFGAHLVLSGREMQSTVWNCFGFVWLFACLVAGAVLGSFTFTRERETGMLQHLMLTALTPRQIVWGKVAAPLVVCGYYSLALLTMFLPCLLSFTSGSFQAGYGLPRAVPTLALVMASVLFTTALGVAISWLSRYSMVAISVSLASVFGLFYAGPIIIRGMVGRVPAVEMLHPFVALDSLVRTPTTGDYIRALGCSFILALVALIIQEVIHVAMLFDVRRAR